MAILQLKVTRYKIVYFTMFGPYKEEYTLLLGMSMFKKVDAQASPNIVKTLVCSGSSRNRNLVVITNNLFSITSIAQGYIYVPWYFKPRKIL